MTPPAAQIAHKDNPLLGMGCAVAAFFLFAVMNVFAKKLSVNHSVIEIAFYRNIIAIWPFLFLIFVMGKREIMTIKTSPRTIVVRSVLGTISLALTFGAFAMMPTTESRPTSALLTAVTNPSGNQLRQSTAHTETLERLCDRLERQRRDAPPGDCRRGVLASRRRTRRATSPS